MQNEKLYLSVLEILKESVYFWGYPSALCWTAFNIYLFVNFHFIPVLLKSFAHFEFSD